MLAERSTDGCRLRCRCTRTVISVGAVGVRGMGGKVDGNGWRDDERMCMEVQWSV